MKISEFYTYAPKSRIKAGDANPNGKYQFYASSPDENRRCDEYLYDCKAIVMGTGGSATIHYYDGKFSTSTDCLVLVPNEKIRAKYLYYFFLGNMSTLEAGFKGAGLKHTNKGYIDSIEIAKMPPLSKQDEIIELFDKLISRIKKQQSQIEKLDELVKARFVEMFDSGYDEDSLINLCSIIDYRGKTPPKANDGLPFITAKNIKMHNLSLEPREYISKDVYDKVMTRGIPKEGDVIFTTEAPLGNVCRIPHFDTEFYIGQRIVTLQTTQLNPSYLEYALSSKDFQKKMLQKSSGSTVIGIRVRLLEQLTIPVPPIEIQDRFANFVAQVDKSKFAISQSLLLLTKAFSASSIPHSGQTSVLLPLRDSAR